MTREEAIMHIDGMINTTVIVKGIVPDEYDIEALRMAIEALQWQDRILTQIEDIVLKEHGERREECT